MATTRLKCACGSGMKVSHGSRKDENGERAQYYVCIMRKKSKNKLCSHKNVRADLVDQAIINDLKDKYLDKDKFLADLREIEKQGKQELVKEFDPVSSIEASIKKAEKERDNLLKKLALIEDDDETSRVLLGNIKERGLHIQKLQGDLDLISNREEDIGHKQNDIELVEKFLDRCGEIDGLELDEQRELMEVIYKRIIWDSEKKALYFVYNGDDRDEDEILSAVLGDEKISYFSTKGRS